MFYNFVLVPFVIFCIFGIDSVYADESPSTPYQKFVLVDFGISLPNVDDTGHIVFLPSGEVSLQNLSFKITEQLNYFQARKKSESFCSTYIQWVEAGRTASPTKTVMAVHLLLLKNDEKNNTEIQRLFSIPRSKSPFVSSYDPFTSYEDCVFKISKPLSEISNFL